MSFNNFSIKDTLNETICDSLLEIERCSFYPSKIRNLSSEKPGQSNITSKKQLAYYLKFLIYRMHMMATNSII